ncbi:MAG: 3-isopropylmalate dehydratase [Candidatus Thermoplasmatota archaeon]|nr:3-isopropylmalate dehydratase [Candidatus Thermoplasmatota archaeon]
MMDRLKGKVWCFGDDISTDTILPSKWKIASFELTELGKHAMEGADESFGKKVKEGDFIVAGTNFGCGSSREQAPMALKGSGVRVIIARTFARIFFRNCVNIGLYPLELDWENGFFETGDEIQVDFTKRIVLNITNGRHMSFVPLPQFLEEIFNAGGLKPFLKSGKSLVKLVEAQDH